MLSSKNKNIKYNNNAFDVLNSDIESEVSTDLNTEFSYFEENGNYTGIESDFENVNINVNGNGNVNVNGDGNGSVYEESKTFVKEEEKRVNYELDCHPILYFLLILFYSIEDYKTQDVYKYLKRFLKEHNLIQDQLESNVELLDMNELIYYCFDILPERLIDSAKIYTIKNCFFNGKDNKKELNKMVIVNSFVIYSLGCLAYQDKWYKFEYHKHGWKITNKMEIVQDINIFFASDLEGLCRRVKLSLDGFTSYVTTYLCSNFITEKDIQQLNVLLYLNNFKDKMDKKPLLRFNDGIYDFQLKGFRPGKPSDFCVKGTGYEYRSKENNEENQEIIMKFLKDLFIEDDVIFYVLKLLASTLTLGNKLRSIVFFIGNGSNGKTTLSNLMKYTLGEYAVAPNVSLFLGQSVALDKPNPHMFELNNARIALCEEPDAKTVSITGDTKAITGNVGFLKARTIYKDLETIYVDLLPIINSNDKLRISNIDTALMDRIIVIPFLQRFMNSSNVQKENIWNKSKAKENNNDDNNNNNNNNGDNNNDNNNNDNNNDDNKNNDNNNDNNGNNNSNNSNNSNNNNNNNSNNNNNDKNNNNIKFANKIWQGRNMQRFAPTFIHILLKYYQYNYNELIQPEIIKKSTNDFILRCDHVGRFIKQKLVDENNEDILKLEDVYQLYKKWYKLFVSTGLLKYTISEFKLDLIRYKIRLIKGHPKNNTEPKDIDYLLGYKLL
ncbi:hypothetical protein BCR32DRAFT_290000 [Anaeromyces robustus]|uniref:SF3 helicase domain-containing protein n=1 Tax=Anaeromyces robustus TaxID=1754192 RepID=A0A1Y1XKX4_9FUNG|nr:hypothetical protein BCR32DRAFT_290000 [Anaeromyces robustus]|eukprot:ORX86417.1 hypothetical protein BCR32DRAFT_290000 [Anaeromyces robustus]